jgi:hypothetical protein
MVHDWNSGLNFLRAISCIDQTPYLTLPIRILYWQIQGQAVKKLTNRLPQLYTCIPVVIS